MFWLVSNRFLRGEPFNRETENKKKSSISLRKKSFANVLFVEDVKQNVSRVNSNVDLVETFVREFRNMVVQKLFENFPNISSKFNQFLKVRL